MIKNLEQFDAEMSLAKADNYFSLLAKGDLAFFRAQLRFTDAGFPAGFWGDVAKAGKLDDVALSKFVGRFFGVDDGVFIKCLHKFGQADGTCFDRPYFNCPWC